MNTDELYVGVMSGTSLDGVDVALVRFEGHQPSLLAKLDYPMPEALKRDLLAINTGQATNLREIGEIDHRLGHLFADAVLALMAQQQLSAESIRAIGNHGQTVFHQPTGAHPFTMQLGDANIIAARTGIETIADFRRKDMALGGQGAPLVPAFHRHLFAQAQNSCVVVNIGGIANVSILHPKHPVIGYDTGPGNMLMDAWCHKHLGRSFDENGAWARSGQICEPLLNQLLQDPYLSYPAPKSTGREHYHLAWLVQHPAIATCAPEDVQRTLCEFTALTIANEATRYAHGDHPQLLVCGGGARNALLMSRLSTLLPTWQVSTTRSAGIDPDHLEAIAFAWLAYCYVHRLPSNLPDVTGAQRFATLGVCFPPY